MKIKKLVGIMALSTFTMLSLTPQVALANKATNILVVASHEDPASLDPAAGIASTDLPFLYAIYDRLLSFDPVTLDPIPMLATSYQWENDNLTLVLKLREGVTFHDGTAFNAESVKISIDYYKEAGRRRDMNAVTSVEVIDTYTVAINVGKPYIVLTSVLADRAGMIVSPAAIAKHGHDGIGANPVGTGPFTLANWAAGDKIELDKFDAYWMADMPRLDGVEFRHISNATSQVTALLTGQIDYVQRVDPVNLPVLAKNPNIRTRVDPMLGYGSISFNTQLAPFDNKIVRQALAYAIDRPAIAALAFGSDIKTISANLPVPPNYWPSTPALENHYSYDPDKARELLAEAGFADGVEFSICTTPLFAGGSVPGDKVIDLLREQIKPAGFTMDVQTMTSISGCIELFNTRQSIASFLVGWSGRPAPYQTYFSLFASNSPYNAGKTKYDGVDELLEQLVTPISQAEQELVFDKLNDRWIDETPAIPMFYLQAVSAYGPNVAGEINDMNGKPNVTTFYFE